MIKAAFFDIDGTLVSFKTHIIPKSTIEALNFLRQKDIKLYIATGRAPSSAKFVLNHFDFDGFVCMSGQYCFDKTETINEDPIDNNDILKLFNYFEQNNIASAFETKSTIYFNRVNDTMLAFLNKIGKTKPDGDIVDISKINEPIYQLTSYITKEEEDIIMKEFPSLKSMRWYPSFTNIIKKEGGKAQGILKLMEKYNWSKDEIMTFGDADNDIDMLELSNYSVCLGEGTPKAKKHAKFITTDVDNDGILNAIRHFNSLL